MPVLRRYGRTVVATAFVLCVLLIPGGSLPTVPSSVLATASSFAIHGAIFFAWSLALAHDFAAFRTPVWPRALFILPVVLVFAYTTETLQSVGGQQRVFEWQDIAADIVGALLAIVWVLVRSNREFHNAEVHVGNVA